MLPSHKSQPRFTVLGIIAIFLWSTSVAFTRSLGEQLGPFSAASAVYLTGGTVSCLFLVARKPWKAVIGFPAKYLFGCGGLFVVYMLCFYAALSLASSRTQAIEIGIVNYLWPSLTLIFLVLLLRMKAKPGIFPGIGLACLGVVLAMTQSIDLSWAGFRTNLSGNPLVYLLAFSAAVSWALYSVLTRKWLPPEKSGGVPLFLLMTGVAAAAMRVFFPEESHWNGRTLVELGYMAIAANLGYIFWEFAMRRGNIALVSSCSYFTPLLSTGMATVYLGVLPGSRLWIGCLLTIAGSVLCKRSIVER